MALCFVAVLGIVLASYIAVCSRAMNLSNRTYQSMLSRQLAEFGLEEGLRAFNGGDWSTWSSTPSNMTAGTWTLDTTNKRATRTIAFNAGKLAQGITGTVKIRIDNYDANTLESTWSSSSEYKIGDLVGRNGIWYRCVKNHTPSQTPNNISNLEYWVPAPISWAWSSGISYKQEDVVCYNGTWYRYSHATSTSGNIPSASSSHWTTIPNVHGAYSSGTYYFANDVAYFSSLNTWRHCTSAGWGGFANWGNAPISWRWSNSKSYAWGDLVYHSAVWYRCISAHSNQAPPGSNWETALSGLWNWSSSSIKYSVGDTVYYNSTGQWHRCIRPHTSSGSLTPANTTYWSNAPLFSTEWSIGKAYVQHDTVRYRGVWYRCILANTSSTSLLPTNASYWIGANTTDTSYIWNATTAYTSGDYRCYGGAWYQCIVSTTAGIAPNNSTYWTATWANSANVTTGAPVVYAEATLIQPGSPNLRTQLRAVIHPAPLFPNAIGATTTINLGSGGTIDSYDSVTDPTYSNPGYSAVVASTYSTAPAATLVSPTVQGYVAAPSYSLGSNTVVKGSAATPSPKADPARISRSAYVPRFDTLPLGGMSAGFSANNFPKGAALVLSATVNLGTPGATTPSRYFHNGNLYVGDAANPPINTININGPVILYISGSLFVTANGATGRININSMGSAEIHIGAGLRVDSGSTGIDNLTLDPKKLTIICDTTATAQHFYSDGTTPFYGALYLPYIGSTTGFYNDNNSVQIYGALSAKKVTYSGANANVHYDTSLRYTSTPGVEQPYSITEWRELPQTEFATMP